MRKQVHQMHQSAKGTAILMANNHFPHSWLAVLRYIPFSDTPKKISKTNIAMENHHVY
jgi:hypothetical protein